MNGKRVGLYLPVSTGEQTIETQRMGLVGACEARGWRIVEEFEDKGISGTKGREKRPGFRSAVAGGHYPQDRRCRGMVR